MKTILLLSLLIACTENYNINSTCKESLQVHGIWYSIYYKQDSVYAEFVENGVGIFRGNPDTRVGDVGKYYSKYEVTGNKRMVI